MRQFLSSLLAIASVAMVPLDAHDSGSPVANLAEAAANQQTTGMDAAPIVAAQSDAELAGEATEIRRCDTCQGSNYDLPTIP